MTLTETLALERLVRWHWDIGDRLADDELITGVPVITELPKDLSIGQQMVQRVQAALGALAGEYPFSTGKSGLIVFVNAGEIVGASTKLSSLTFNARMRIACIEARTYNAAPSGFAPDGVGLHAHHLASRVAQVVQNYRSLGLVDAARPQDVASEHAGWLPPDFRDADDKLDLLTWGLELQTLINVPIPTKLATPTIVKDANTITITGTVGATVRYTTDLNYPTAKNNSPVYSAPFAITPPVVVRAVATQTGYVPSDCALLEVLE